MSSRRRTAKNIVFFHPDLGIGGAERLVIDAAVGLQNRGHKVTIYTSHCDKNHCFEEARDGTLDVRVRGNTLIPPSVFSRFSILCAILRQLHLIFQIAVFSTELAKLQPDAFFVDQLSAGLPALRMLYPNVRILFYCHFPDLLLAQGRTKWWKRAYRIPFDWVEEWSMTFADEIAVNSGFTKGMVSQVWPSLAKERDLKIVYPCVDIRPKKIEKEEGLDEQMWKSQQIILSINRFERKKDIGLAIRAYAGLSKDARKGVRLVLAGGYDYRVQENVSYHTELVELAESYGLKTATTKNIVTALNIPEDVNVLFLLSVPNSLKTILLKSARLLVYTPSNEHFGIVPLEAMLVGLPVLAANTGGPLETVVDGFTGWLRSPDKVDEWTDVMDTLLHKLSKDQVTKMAVSGRRRVEAEFSDIKMAERLEDIVIGMQGKRRKSIERLKWASYLAGILLAVSGLWVVSLIRGH